MGVKGKGRVPRAELTDRLTVYKNSEDWWGEGLQIEALVALTEKKSKAQSSATQMRACRHIRYREIYSERKSSLRLGTFLIPTNI